MTATEWVLLAYSTIITLAWMIVARDVNIACDGWKEAYRKQIVAEALNEELRRHLKKHEVRGAS